MSRTSAPPTRTAPSVTSQKRGMSVASVDLPAPEGPTSAVTVPGSSSRADRPQDLRAAVIGEADVVELDRVVGALGACVATTPRASSAVASSAATRDPASAASRKPCAL